MVGGGEVIAKTGQKAKNVPLVSLSHSACKTYDGIGQLVEERDRNGNVRTYTYDKDGRRTSMTDPLGNVLQTIDALGKVTTTEYDGNVAKVTDTDGFVTEYTYNALDMVTHINYNGGKQVDYQYNKVGDLVKMDDWTGTNTFEVDLLNRITTATDHKGHETTYAYDSVGNQVSVGYPDGTTATKEYDLVHNLTSVAEHDGRTTTYAYDGMRRVAHMSYPDGWQEDYTYDSIGQNTSILDTDPTRHKGTVL